MAVATDKLLDRLIDKKSFSEIATHPLLESAVRAAAEIHAQNLEGYRSRPGDEVEDRELSTARADNLARVLLLASRMNDWHLEQLEVLTETMYIRYMSTEGGSDLSANLVNHRLDWHSRSYVKDIDLLSRLVCGLALTPSEDFEPGEPDADGAA